MKYIIFIIYLFLFTKNSLSTENFYDINYLKSDLEQNTNLDNYILYGGVNFIDSKVLLKEWYKKPSSHEL